MDGLISDGKIIKNTYEVDRLIGSGTFGEVYRVTHKFLGNQALKVLKPDMLKEAEQNTFINEATILSNITHPNVVRVYDAHYFRFKKFQFSRMQWNTGLDKVFKGFFYFFFAEDAHDAIHTVIIIAASIIDI